MKWRCLPWLFAADENAVDHQINHTMGEINHPFDCTYHFFSNVNNSIDNIVYSFSCNEHVPFKKKKNKKKVTHKDAQ